METNTTFFVALLRKETFESQTVLTTDHLLSQSHRLLRMVIAQIIYIYIYIYVYINMILTDIGWLNKSVVPSMFAYKH